MTEGAAGPSASWDAEVAAAVRNEFGEGPYWDARNDRLVWVDLLSGNLWTLASSGRETKVGELGEPVGFVVGREDGGFLAGTASGLVALDEEFRPAGVLAVPPDVDGGARGKAGAHAMAGQAALRSGAGLVTVATAASVLPIIASSMPELMTEALQETAEGSIAAQTIQTAFLGSYTRVATRATASEEPITLPGI